MNILEQPEPERFFHGTVAVCADGSGLSARRFTATQLDYFGKNGSWAIRAKCNAGQTIELRTCSRSLRLTAQITGAARSYFGLDIEIDGAIRRSLRYDRMKNPVNLELPMEHGRPGELHDVRIHVPNVTSLRFIGLEVADEAQVQPLPRRPRQLLCLGDSITQGMCAVSPASTYTVQLARLVDAELLNQGVGGHVFDPDALDPALPWRPDLITVAYGTNDWAAGCTTHDVREALAQFVARLRGIYPPPTPVAVISPVWRQDWREPKPGGDLASFAEAILETAAASDDAVRPIDGFRLVPHDAVYFADGAHPNELGFMHYALNLWRQLQDCSGDASPSDAAEKAC